MSQDQREAVARAIRIALTDKTNGVPSGCIVREGCASVDYPAEIFIQSVISAAIAALRARASCRCGELREGLYVASKTRHSAMWKNYRDRGWPIISTWIDEAGEGESLDLNDLWRRCVLEASSAKALVVYREEDDVLKGAWVEIGAALARGVPVFAVGLKGFTISHDKRIRHFETIEDAMNAALTPSPEGEA